MNMKQLIDLQNNVVLTLANGIEFPWDFIVVNFEIGIVEGDRMENALALAFTRDGEGLKEESFLIPHQCYVPFVRLHEAMESSEKKQWGSCTLEIESSGRYRFLFSYEAPKRLYGIRDAEAMLDGYVPTLSTEAK
jgi:hypothetical protein